MLTLEAAEHLAGLRLQLVGIDWLSIADPGEAADVHRILLGAGIAVLEGLDLRDVTPGTYELAALPLNMPGVDGAPARAALMVPA
jgi:arylformamidase